MEHLQNVKNLIEQDITVHYSLTDLATYAGINTFKLKKGFKLLFGISLYHYLKELRLKEGQYLLENTDRNIKWIARSTGYRHASGFVYAFKRRYGKTPGEWRKQKSR